MTKILNSLLVTGTSSTSQALGVTAGQVNFNGGLSVGTWNKPTTTDFYILSASSSTNPVIIRNFSNSKDILKVSDSGQVEINNDQTSSSIVTLTLGSTSSFNGAGSLQIGSTNSGLLILGDNNFPSILSFRGRFTFNNTLNNTLNYNSLWFDLGTQSIDVPMISSNTNSTRSLRLASGGGSLFLSTNVPVSSTYSTIDRLIIPGTSPFSNPRFVNVGTLQIENIGISTRNIGTTSNSFPNTLLIGGSQSSINISTTYSIPTTWSQGSIFITPGGNINMTASHFPVSGLTHSNNSNIIIVNQLTNIPTTGNFNLMIGGGSKITTGSQNVGLGNALAQSNPALGELTTGSQNVAVGSNAMGRLVSGNNNTALGDRSLNSSGSTSFSNNVGVGIQSGQNVATGNNIFIGANAGRSFNGTGSSVLYFSSHIFSANDRIEASVAHFSSTYATWSGTPPSWSTSPNYGNVVIIGNESSGSRDSVSLNNTGVYRSLFFGRGMWHLSNSVDTFFISTSMPTLMTWTSSGTLTPNNNAPGSSLELVAGVGRGGGTAGDLYFSTGQLTASGTFSLQNKLNRMTIKGGSGFVGIGPGTFSNSPTTLLHIWGTSSGAIRIQDGSQGLGKVLTSDANGVGTWATSSSSGMVSGSGSASFVPLFFSTTSLTSSNIYQGASGSILIGYTSSSSTYTLDSNTLRVRGDVYFDNATLTAKKFYLNGSYLFNDVTGNLALGYQSLGGNDISNSLYNIGIGYRSLYGLTQSGNYNIGIGYQSLYSNSTGDSNVAIGYQSGYNMIDGVGNISIGRRSMVTATSGSYRISIGDGSLENSTGSWLVGIGVDSVKNSTNSYNIGLGSYTLRDNTTGQYNVAIGYQSLMRNISGSQNISIGLAALETQTQSNYNIAIGYAAQNLNEGNYNITLGTNTLRYATMSTYNIAIGIGAIQYNVQDYNIAIGHNALRYGSQSTSNTAIGHFAMSNDDGSTSNIAMGRAAMQRFTYSIVGLSSSYIHSSYNVAIGDYTLRYYQGISASTTGGCLAIGYSALGELEVGASNIAIGLNAMSIGSYSSYNIAIGNQALYNQGNVSDVSHPLSKYSIAIGYRALYTATASHVNNAIGYQALVANTSGVFNLAIGHSSMGLNTSGGYNTAIGPYRPLYSNTTGENNVAIGYMSLYSSNGSDNLSIGYQAMYNNVSGNRNVSLGYRSLYGLTNSNSNNNIAIGDKSALGFQDGQFNIFLSSTTASTTMGITSGSYNTVIGHNIIFRENTSNNTIIGSRVNVPVGATNSIIIADGSGNQRILINSDGNVGINQGLTGLTYSKFIIVGKSSTANSNPLYDYENNALVIKNSNGEPFFVARNDKNITINSNSGSSGYPYWVSPKAAFNIISSTSDSSDYSMWIMDKDTNYTFRLRNDGNVSFSKPGPSPVPSKVGINRDFPSLSYELDVVGTASVTENLLVGKKVTSYNGETTQGNGLTTIVSNTSIFNVGGTYPSTPIYNITRNGLFRYNLNLIAGTGSGTITPYITFNNGEGTYSYNLSGYDNTAGSSNINMTMPGMRFFYGSVIFYGVTSSVSHYTTTTGSPTYSIHAVLERLT